MGRILLVVVVVAVVVVAVVVRRECSYGSCFQSSTRVG
jgi:hypothetical protein